MMFLKQFAVLVGIIGAFPLSTQAEKQKIPFKITFEQAGYEKILASNINVYKHKTSDIIQLGAEGRIKAPPSEVFLALLSYQKQVGILDRLSESRVLKRGSNWLEVYQRLNLPVISDRDFTLRVSWKANPENNKYTIKYRATPKQGPAPRKGIVRVHTHQGSWQLKPAASGQETFVRFQVAIDLAGWLPRWMMRSGAGKEIPQLFASICQLVREQQGVACVL